MADESLLELERVLRAAPDDEAARRRLVALLARSGRRREALEHAARIPGGRDLANGLWREDLARLEKTVAVPGTHEVTQIAIEPTGKMLALSLRGELRIVEVGSDRVLHSASGRRDDLLVARREQVFVQDYARGGVIASFEWSAGELRSSRRSVRDLATIHDVAPRGDLLLLQGSHHGGIYAWPSLDPIVERPSRLNPPVVDWETRRLLLDGMRGIEVLPFTGPALPVIPGRGERLVALGAGLVSRYEQGLVLRSLVHGWRVALYELKGVARPGLGKPSLSGSFVRIVLAGVPLRFELDLERGEVLSRPDRVERLALEPSDDDAPIRALWHPRADFVLQSRRGGPFELRSLEGETVLRLPPNCFPQAWTEDGRALLVLHAAGEEGRAWIELWRC